jgi:hypothetical protein
MHSLAPTAHAATQARKLGRMNEVETVLGPSASVAAATQLRQSLSALGPLDALLAAAAARGATGPHTGSPLQPGPSDVLTLRQSFDPVAAAAAARARRGSTSGAGSGGGAGGSGPLSRPLTQQRSSGLSGGAEAERRRVSWHPDVLHSAGARASAHAHIRNLLISFGHTSLPRCRFDFAGNHT